MFEEPEQGLAGKAKFRHLVKHKGEWPTACDDRDPSPAVADLHKADRGSDDEFTAPGLLIAGRQGALTQKIELILVETAPQSQQQPVIALAR
ncbi:hypothetical protein [Mesorhizobium sp. WSM1293]|uniref:hypothetical protein n=1 Tax=Mesorhizobium sp. WSM1293 TaxID=1040984 RepID=UPI0004844BCE|nr:hypothetical protein [Mesorhizobium sp. WSM1293]